jgi:serine/threonine protein kinase
MANELADIFLAKYQKCTSKTPTAAGFNTYGSRLGELLVHEAEVYELLQNHLHPNIMGFQGSLVMNGRVRGLCLDKYDETLSERWESSKPLDVEACMKEIKAGVEYLHLLGLAHNDVKPSNILLKYADGSGDMLAISDFETCYPEGAKLVLKLVLWAVRILLLRTTSLQCVILKDIYVEKSESHRS